MPCRPRVNSSSSPGSTPRTHPAPPVPGDFAAQVEPAFDRLESAPAGVGLRLQHVVRLGTFIVDHDPGKLETLGKALHSRFGNRLPARTLSGVAALALPGMLFEVDAIAVRPTPRIRALSPSPR